MQHFKVKSKYVGSVSNNIFIALRIFGWLSIIGGIITGIFISSEIGGGIIIFLTLSIYGGVSGVLLLGFAEVLELLEQIAMSEFSVDQDDQGISQQSKRNSRIQQEEPAGKSVQASSTGSSVIKHNIEDKNSSDVSSSNSTVDVSQYSSLFSKR